LSYILSPYKYYVYITTNKSKSTLYIGVTNNIARRLEEHYENKDNENNFAGKYHCYNLVYCEVYERIEEALEREKQIKKWRREKKNKLIEEQNPNWNFLNGFIF
jgi:putative endonuclease